MRPFSSYDKHAYVAFAGLMHGDPQGFRETQVQSVEGWIGQHNIPDCAVSFKSDRRHCQFSFFVPTQVGRDRCLMTVPGIEPIISGAKAAAIRIRV
jgi:hypothetical protein